MQGKCKEWLKHSRRSEMGRNDVASNWRFVVRSAASPFGNYDPSCEMFRYGRCEHQNLCQTLPFFSMRSWEHATVTEWFSLFSRLYMHFLKLKYEQGLRLWPHPTAKLFDVFSRFSHNGWKLPKRHTNDLANTHVYLWLYTYKRDLLRLLARPAAW